MNSFASRLASALRSFSQVNWCHLLHVCQLSNGVSLIAKSATSEDQVGCAHRRQDRIKVIVKANDQNPDRANDQPVPRFRFPRRQTNTHLGGARCSEVGSARAGRRKECQTPARRACVIRPFPFCCRLGGIQ